ncbi:hypothetical protein G6O69_15115 [Pseudenhygromyxa sp. WMMC2535]|uniref:hypothetical protein n=1 Tax=Pseudenhygromyxa sp. WMMC2535 TaxID=2712867 RepID=UPI0015536E1C|nr:hypothetical protein [Pseudenhygromyxa sp. WMMC2535]NVB39171.1 hypothetical protein [Pseudenhygromyxa sp. WMMC2535]
MRAHAPSLVLTAALALASMATSACKESGNDYYAEGLRLLGEAERGDCKLGFDRASGQQVINAERVRTCLEKTKAGLEQLQKARELGVDHREMSDLIEKTELEVERLEKMYKMVSRMQGQKNFEDLPGT